MHTEYCFIQNVYYNWYDASYGGATSFQYLNNWTRVYSGRDSLTGLDGQQVINTVYRYADNVYSSVGGSGLGNGITSENAYLGKRQDIGAQAYDADWDWIYVRKIINFR